MHGSVICVHTKRRVRNVNVFIVLIFHAFLCSVSGVFLQSGRKSAKNGPFTTTRAKSRYNRLRGTHRILGDQPPATTVDALLLYGTVTLWSTAAFANELCLCTRRIERGFEFWHVAHCLRCHTGRPIWPERLFPPGERDRHIDFRSYPTFSQPLGAPQALPLFLLPNGTPDCVSQILCRCSLYRISMRCLSRYAVGFL